MLKKTDNSKVFNRKLIECGCTEFEFICEPDDTGAIISHKKCDALEFIDIADLPKFIAEFPNTKIASKKEESVTETDAFDTFFKDLAEAFMYAPSRDPERQNYISNKIKAKYNIVIKPHLCQH